MNLRKYNNGDRTQVVALWNTVFPDDPPHNEPNSVISEKLKVDDLIFVAEKDQQIVGACIAGYDGHRGWLYAVAIHPSNRRSGVGSKLVKHTLEQLKCLGCMKTNIQIRSTNTQVVSFYESLGFSTEDRLSMGIFIE
ncbi:GNAT family N-acetyltransferase [Chromatiales bacterium (ex Bugula neritina AB1)]|nr:GNAT family N-acetyltransferase [Chromatiales bacterium (ex Bugula neritina AB1)]